MVRPRAATTNDAHVACNAPNAGGAGSVLSSCGACVPRVPRPFRRKEWGTDRRGNKVQHTHAGIVAEVSHTPTTSLKVRSRYTCRLNFRARFYLIGKAECEGSHATQYSFTT